MKRRLWFPALVASSIALAAFGATTHRSARAEDDDEPIKDGKWHYTRQCAGCHNDNGDGKGPTITQLGLQARDFKQGGFAFGDSREQMKRTITSGIPGRSPMPSFKGILDDDEMELVIDYVRTLMPPRDETPPKNTEMIVKDRALIARGKLPPIAEGAQEVPRGLLIGTPEGMTFEYDISDVRLLGVRLGRFANREDWGDRGGAFLRPLGQLLFPIPPDESGAALAPRTVTADGSWVSERRVVVSTQVRGSGASVTYAGMAFSGPERWRCVETLQAVTLSVGAGYARRFELDNCGATTEFLIGGKYSAPWREHLLERHKMGVATPSEHFQWRWVTCDLGSDGTEAVLVDSSVEFEAERPSSLKAVSHMTFLGASREPAPGTTIRSFTVRLAKWSDELAAQLEKELGL